MGSTQQQQSLGGQEVGSRAAVIAALLIGNFALAFGPWLVRMADVGPSASAMWRLALAAPVLFMIAAYRRQPLTLPSNALYWTMLLSGLFFAVDLAAWHIGILKTKMANATLFANAASLFFPIWGFLVARAWPDIRHTHEPWSKGEGEIAEQQRTDDGGTAANFLPPKRLLLLRGPHRPHIRERNSQSN
jgi:hypothetical protein